MGRGTDAARASGAGLHADVIDDLKDQLLIAFLRRLGGQVTIPVKEVDETGRFNLLLRLDGPSFVFKLEGKDGDHDRSE